MTKGALLGLAGAGIVSLVCAAISGTFAGYSRHPLEAIGWLFPVGLLPGAVAGAFLATAVARRASASNRVWLVSCGTAFTATALSASLGAVAVQAARFGIHGVNVVGYLQWCLVYALVLDKQAFFCTFS